MSGGNLDLLGVNLAGGEFGAVGQAYGTGYTYPTHAEIDYEAASGMNVIRLPFLWERIQPALGGPLDPAELARIDDVVNYATSKGMKVDLDVHDYGNYGGQPIGSSAVPNSAFADLWGKIAAHYATNVNVMFGLMNEPQQSSASGWLGSVNAAITAIRGAGASQEILVPGIGYDGAWTWTTGPNASVIGSGVNDPLNNYAFEVHQYLDSDGSGTHQNVMSSTIGSQRLADITTWAENTGHSLFLGEFGTASDATSLSALGDMLSTMSQHADVWQGGTYWAAGPWWGNYMYSAEPSNGVDTGQMKVLEQYEHRAPTVGSTASVPSTSGGTATGTSTPTTAPPTSAPATATAPAAAATPAPATTSPPAPASVSIPPATPIATHPVISTATANPTAAPAAAATPAPATTFPPAPAPVSAPPTTPVATHPATLTATANPRTAPAAAAAPAPTMPPVPAPVSVAVGTPIATGSATPMATSNPIAAPVAATTQVTTTAPDASAATTNPAPAPDASDATTSSASTSAAPAVVPSAPVPTFDTLLAIPATAPDAAPARAAVITIDPGVTFASPTDVTLTGTVSDTAASVHVLAGRRDLGAATVAADGTWALPVTFRAGFHGGIAAVATSGDGLSGQAAAPFSLTTGIAGRGCKASLDSYDGSGTYLGTTQYDGHGNVYLQWTETANADGGVTDTSMAGSALQALGVSSTKTRYDANGNLVSDTLNVLAGGVHSLAGFGANDTFVFQPHAGRDSIAGFVTSGPGHDVLSLPASEFTSFAQVLSDVSQSGSDTVIKSAGHDTITLLGVSASALTPRDFRFHV